MSEEAENQEDSLLVNHEALKPLVAPLRSHYKAALTAKRTNNPAVPSNASARYAESVLQRAQEIDNSLSSMKQAVIGIEAIDFSDFSAIDPFVYHYENFWIRAVGAIDRAHRLIGSALGMKRRTLEGTLCNPSVIKLVESKFPKIHESLLEVVAVVGHYKKLRNDVIHSRQFSNRYVSTAISCRHLRLNEYQQDAGEILQIFSHQALSEMNVTLECMPIALSSMIDSLSAEIRQRLAVHS